MTSGKGAKKPSDKSMTKMAGPWMPLQDPLKNQIENAKRVTAQPWEYGPDRVAPLDPATAWGIQQGTARAMDPTATQGLTDAYGNVSKLAAGGLTGAGTGYLDQVASQGFGEGAGTAYMDKIATTGGGRGAGAAYMDKIAKSGITNPAFKDLQNVLTAANKGSPAAVALTKYAKEAGGGSGGIEYLRDVVSGKYLGQNPYIDKLVADVTADANKTLLPSLEGRMSQAGRMGSNAEAAGQGKIAKELASKANEIRYTDYENERGMQQQAGLALPGAFGTEMNTKIGASTAQADDHYRALDERLKSAQAVGSDVYAREGIQMDAATRADADHQAVVDQQLRAAGMSNENLRANVGLRANVANMANQNTMAFNNQSLQAASQLPGQYQSLYAPSDNAMRYGAVNQAQDTAQRAEAADKFQYNQSAQYDQLQRRLGLFSGIGGMTNPGVAGQAYGQGINGPSGTEVAIGNVIGLTGAAMGGGGMMMRQPAAPGAAPPPPPQYAPQPMGSYNPPGYNPSMRY
jgi:hypothetical protein